MPTPPFLSVRIGTRTGHPLIGPPTHTGGSLLNLCGVSPRAMLPTNKAVDHRKLLSIGKAFVNSVLCNHVISVYIIISFLLLESFAIILEKNGQCIDEFAPQVHLLNTPEYPCFSLSLFLFSCIHPPKCLQLFL